MGLKDDKSPGPDGLHPRVLGEVALEISGRIGDYYPMFDRFRISYCGDWRIANVIPFGLQERSERENRELQSS